MSVEHPIKDQRTILAVAASILGKETYKKFSKREAIQILKGYDVELEHGNGVINKAKGDDKLFMEKTNVTNDDTRLTLMIALSHLAQDENYYDKLGKMEDEAKKDPSHTQRNTQNYLLGRGIRDPSVGVVSADSIKDDPHKKELMLKTLIIIGYNSDEKMPDDLLNQIVKGFNVELEHGTILGNTYNVTSDDKEKTLKIVLAHLWEIDDYYTRLRRILPSFLFSPMPEIIASAMFTLDVSDIHKALQQ